MQYVTKRPFSINSQILIYSLDNIICGDKMDKAYCIMNTFAARITGNDPIVGGYVLNEIRTTKQIGQCGTSLTINVTKETRALNLERGDYVDIIIRPHEENYNDQ